MNRAGKRLAGRLKGGAAEHDHRLLERVCGVVVLGVARAGAGVAFAVPGVNFHAITVIGMGVLGHKINQRVRGCGPGIRWFCWISIYARVGGAGGSAGRSNTREAPVYAFRVSNVVR